MSRVFGATGEEQRMRATRGLAGLVLCGLCVAGLAAGCSTDEQPVGPQVKVTVYGWGPQESGQAVGWVQGMPLYPQAQTVLLKVTDPAAGTVLDVESTQVGSGRVEIPQIPYREGLRLDLEVLDAVGNPIASGSTEPFTMTADGPSRTFRMMVAPSNAFAPAGSVVAERGTGERKFAQSRLDYRGLDRDEVPNFWLGRVGHATASTSDGRVLVVGGADAIPGHALGGLPRFRQAFADVQIYDPATGYFSDLAYDEEAGGKLKGTLDRLSEPRAFHTLTPLGQDRWIVAGGFTSRNDLTRPVNTVDLIDLNAPPGFRVSPLLTTDAEPVVLAEARGYHTATLVPGAGKVVIAGGVGREGEDDFVDTIEILDLGTLSVSTAEAKLAQGRAEHGAALVGASGDRVWLLGGRDASGALTSTEVVDLSGGAVNVSTGAPLATARFGFGTVPLARTTGSEKVMVIGGFTGVDGAVTGAVEIGEPDGDKFFSQSDAGLSLPRGGLRAVELRESGDVVVFGGRDGEGETVSQAERLFYRGFGQENPYVSVQEGMGRYHSPRYLAEATYMSTGQILITGGIGDANGTIVGLDTAEIYNALDPVGAVLVGP